MNINKSILTNRVKGKVNFVYYQDESLWYETEDKFKFPVPITDTVNSQGGSSMFLAQDKGIIFMRWIRKHMEFELQQRLYQDISEDEKIHFSLSED